MNGPERSDSISVQVLLSSTTSPIARPTPIEEDVFIMEPFLKKGCTKPNTIVPVEVHMILKPSPRTWNLKKKICCSNLLYAFFITLDF